MKIDCALLDSTWAATAAKVGSIRLAWGLPNRKLSFLLFSMTFLNVLLIQGSGARLGVHMSELSRRQRRGLHLGRPRPHPHPRRLSPPLASARVAHRTSHVLAVQRARWCWEISQLLQNRQGTYGYVWFLLKKSVVVFYLVIYDVMVWKC